MGTTKTIRTILIVGDMGTNVAAIVKVATKTDAVLTAALKDGDKTHEFDQAVCCIRRSCLNATPARPASGPTINSKS